MTQEEKQLLASEYSSVLLSCFLAVEFNQAKPNKALRHTLKCLHKRMTSPVIKALIADALKQMYLVGWLAKQSNNINRVTNVGQETFLAMGASLEK